MAHNSLFTLDPNRDYPVLTRGEGVYLYDNRGRQYLDGAAGIAVVAVGYGRRRIADAMARQALKLPYVASNLFANAPAAELAHRIAAILPGENSAVHFTSGGSEAVEVAFKICRQFFYDAGQTEKRIVIARETSYHGATLGALSATGYAGRRKKFLPLLQDWPHIPAAYCYRCPFDLTYPRCDLACARALEQAIIDVGPRNVMAFIAEPVVGAAGAALVPPPEYWPMVRETCTRHGVLLIADEVLTGFGRTGKPFAVEHWNVAPDLITMAKGISSGYAPLGAVGVSRSIRDGFTSRHMPFDHIFTYAANPVSAAAASAALAIWEEENLSANAAETGAYLLHCLETLKKHEIVGDVRGLGMLAGIEFVRDRKTRTPFDPELGVAGRIAATALQNGLITYPGGDILSLFPPLTFTRRHVDELVSKLDDALSKVAGEIINASLH